MHRLFTLVELLVVVAVIAILAGLLLPALHAARSKGVGISCLGNLKQLGTAYSSYMGEWNHTPKVWASSYRWVDLMVPYLAKKSDRSSGNVFVCPSDLRPDSAKVISSSGSNPDTGKLSYGINQCYPSVRLSDTPILWNGIHERLIAKPSEFIALADAGNYLIGTTVAVPVFGIKNGEFQVDFGFCKYLSFRHHAAEKTFHSVFADGHAASMKLDSTPNRYWDYTNAGYEF